MSATPLGSDLPRRKSMSATWPNQHFNFARPTTENAQQQREIHVRLDFLTSRKWSYDYWWDGDLKIDCQHWPNHLVALPWKRDKDGRISSVSAAKTTSMCPRTRHDPDFYRQMFHPSFIHITASPINHIVNLLRNDNLPTMVWSLHRTGTQSGKRKREKKGRREALMAEREGFARLIPK